MRLHLGVTAVHAAWSALRPAMACRPWFGWAAWSLLSLGTPSAGEAQKLDRFERDRIRTMLDQVRHVIAERYYDSTFGGVNLDAAYETAAARVRGAANLDQALAAIAQFALELRDSHTFFVPPQRTVSVDYGWDMAMVGDSCFVVRVEPGSDAARQGVALGDRIVSLNGYAPARSNLWVLQYLFHLLRPQSSIQVVLRAPNRDARPMDLKAAVRQQKAIMDLTGADGGGDIAHLIRNAQRSADELRSVTVELGPDVLIWKLPTFDHAPKEIRSALKKARNRKTLVLDLRGNGGGAVDAMAALLGGLYRDSAVVGTLRERRKQSRFVAKGTGDDAFDGQLLVLVDSRSASASEVVARVVQLTGRGHVLGDRTSGAVMRGTSRFFTVGMETAALYGVNVTDADLVMSDGGRLEGEGVVPDTLLLPTATDLAAERDPVLAHALGLAGVAIGPEKAGALLRVK